MSVLRDLEAYVAKRISLLSADNPESKAMLARLRRAAGKDPTDTPEVWDVTLDELPESMSGRYYDGSYHPSNAEQTVHVCLTVFAVHAQGSLTTPQREGVSLGKAARMLSSKMDNDSIKTRFGAVITSSNLTELAHHLRGLVQMFKSDETIGLDYVMLARDLYRFTYTDSRDDVLFKWGEDFFARKNSNDSEQKEE